MKKVLIVIILLTLLFSGCVETESIALGTYHCECDSGILYLSSNGQYELLIDDLSGYGGLYGNYTIHDERLLLKRSFLGDLLVFSINDTYLIDKDGDRWTLETSG